MRTFIQVYDNSGQAQLKGGSNFKGHVDWLELEGWSVVGGSSAANSAGRPPQFHSAQLYVRADNPIVSLISDVVAGSAYTGDWSKATLDAFKDAQDPAWSTRVTFLNPLFTALSPIGTPADNSPLMQATLEFSSSSVDYRDSDAKVTHYMPSGVIWDPTEQVCRVFDPEDAVSHLPQ